MSITQLRLMPFQHIDDHTVYCVRVKVNNFRFHEIKRPFQDYVEFSQRLQQQLPKNNKIPKLKKDNFSKLIKSQTQKHMDRQEELDYFIKALLKYVPLELARSDFFMNFFSDFSSSTLPICTTTPSRNALKRVFSLRRPIIHSSSESMLSRSATVSVPCMVSPLQQQQQNQQHTQHQQVLLTRNSSIHSSNISSCSDIDIDEEDEDEEVDDPEEEDDDVLNMIKLKIIYNVQNIIIIRVQRCISWEELNTQVRHKFALLKIDLPENLVLQVTCNRNSMSSSISNVTVTGTAISTQDELSLSMQTAWSSLEKVTLRITL